MKGYAAIPRPLNVLLVGHLTNPEIRLKASVKRTPFTWGDEQQWSFDTIIDRLTNPPVLGCGDYRLPFSLHTDASSTGLGAALYQRQDGVKRVIAYASRSLKPAEKNYPAHKLEFLALKWAVSEKFHDYLYGTKFEAISDNNPLNYILTTAKLDATGQKVDSRPIELQLRYQGQKCQEKRRYRWAFPNERRGKETECHFP